MRTPRSRVRVRPETDQFPGFEPGQKWHATYNPANPERGPLVVFGIEIGIGETKEVEWMTARALSMCPGVLLELEEE